MKGMTNASPRVGQFAAGKLGTIKGGTADGSVQAQEDGTGTVVGWSGKASTADVAKKADKTALDATDAKVTQIQTAVGDCFNAAEITSDGKLQLTAVDGQVNALTLPRSEDAPTDFTNLFSEIIGRSSNYQESQPELAFGRALTEATPLYQRFYNPDLPPTAWIRVLNTTDSFNYGKYSTYTVTDADHSKIDAFYDKIISKFQAIYPKAVAEFTISSLFTSSISETGSERLGILIRIAEDGTVTRSYPSVLHAAGTYSASVYDNIAIILFVSYITIQGNLSRTK